MLGATDTQIHSHSGMYGLVVVFGVMGLDAMCAFLQCMVINYSLL